MLMSIIKFVNSKSTTGGGYYNFLEKLKIKKVKHIETSTRDTSVLCVFLL